MNRRDFLKTTAVTLAAGAPAAAQPELPFRQIHLDFHTSELIPDVAADFDAREFAATLKAARVNSINVFAKCHHGWAYYDTRIAARHPSLKIDLLGEMVRACRASGIHVLYYYSLVWDVLQARRHPEWRMLTRDGKTIGGTTGEPNVWPWLCMNTPYLDHCVRENEELIANYDVDGAWFDILKQPPEGCWCRWCAEERKALRLGDSPEDIHRHNKHVAKKVQDRLNAVVLKRFPDGLRFYNSRMVIGVRDEIPRYSHIEIESLPSGGWGYTHFQQRVRYLRTLGKDMVGMTGRFHKSWGDFGGLKNQAALDFECLNFVANGAKCCVGDQLHPRGRLDKTTYERIGRTYAKIEALEPWARGTRAAADIGVVSSAVFQPESTQKLTPEDQGFTNMLVELHQQFNVLDLDEDFKRYKVVILPDVIQPSEALIRKLDAYAAQGGAVILSHESLVDIAARRFAWSAAGVRYEGLSKYRGEYLLPKNGAFPSLAEHAYFLYQRGSAISAEPGTEVLATYGHPYFDRAEDRFSSHRQTPLGQRTEEPLITRRGRVVYIANPFFRSYAQDGVGAYRAIVSDLLAALLPQPALVAPSLPSTALATVLEQPAQRRTIVHLLHYPMARRAPDLDIIEEPAWIIGQEVRVRMAQALRRVTLVPDGASVPFRYEGGYAVCRVERALGHACLSFEA